MMPRLNRSLRPLALALLGASLATSAARADVDYTGDVLPRENPFTPAQEGLPLDGNVVDIFLLATDPQPDWERNQDVVIGRTGVGTVRITAEAFLNYEHLILGGNALDLDRIDDPMNFLGASSGLGNLVVQDFGSIFNNHPAVIPSIYWDDNGTPNNPDDDNPADTIFARPNNRTANGLGELGFDAYVGLTGDGNLTLLDGGRAEIQDALIVGYLPQASGKVLVSGPGSHLSVYGGLEPAAPGGMAPLTRAAFAADVTTLHQMIIGAYGDGEMVIDLGGRVDAHFGAAIGTTQSNGDDDNTMAINTAATRQGNGRVVVDGLGSSWNIDFGSFEMDALPNFVGTSNAALAVGEFVSDDNPTYTEDEAGQGYLSIRNGGVVNITQYDDNTLDTDADLVVGFSGTVDLQGGRLNVDDDTHNDGVLQGGGDVVTGTFNNRELGRVTVGPAQTLHLTANILGRTYESADGAVNFNSEDFVAANFGKIEVLGDGALGKAEFRYSRGVTGLDLSATAVGPPDPDVFLNGDTDFNPMSMPARSDVARGQIVARDANLRFQTGVWNQGDINFTGGDSVVTGKVHNATSELDAMMMPVGNEGRIVISNGSHVTFEDEVANNGLITLIDESDVLFKKGYTGSGALIDANPATITVEGDFVLGTAVGGVGGTLGLVTNGGPSGNANSRVLITGDAFFDIAGAEISIDNLNGTASLGDESNLITVLGVSDIATAIANGNFTFKSLPVLDNPNLFAQPVYSDGNLGLRVVSTAGMLVGDYNGDGQVNLADYVVARDSIGAPVGSLENDPTNLPIQGYHLSLWGLHFGQVGSGAGLAPAVPEPASLGLALGACLLGARRRRRA